MEPNINNNNSRNDENVWLVTGTSSGLGLELVKKLLVQGNKVAAFTRKPEQLSESLKELLTSKHIGDNLLIVKTDVSNDQDVKKATEKTVGHFGKIDVVVNNHGYGYVGSIEELEDSEFREIFNVNFFGSLNVLRHTTPYLRKQKSGTVFIVTSLLGWVDLPNYSAYSSSKHALNAAAFSLGKELKPFNVDVVLLTPGGFKTPMVSGGNLRVPNNPIPEYNSDAFIPFLHTFSETSIGNPTKFADVVIELSKLNEKPDNIFVGSDSVGGVKVFLERTLKNIDKWYDLSIKTDFQPSEIKTQMPNLEF